MRTTTRRRTFTKAEIKRACEAAPGRTVEIVAADGSVIRLVPGEKAEANNGKVVEKRGIRF